MKKLLVALAFLPLLLLSSCRGVDYTTPDNRHLTLWACGMDTKIGHLKAQAGDTKLDFSQYESDVDAATVKAIDDALIAATEIIKRIPSTALMGAGPNAQASDTQKKMEALNNCLETARNLTQKLRR